MIPFLLFFASDIPADLSCSMQAGKMTINLENICPQPKRQTTHLDGLALQTEQPTQEQTPSDAELQQLGVFKWARAYCQAVANGKDKTMAEQAGVEAVNQWLLNDAITLFGRRRVLNFSGETLEQVFLDGPAQAAELCSEPDESKEALSEANE